MIHRLNHNPIARLNIASHEKTHHNKWKIRPLWLMPLLLVSTIPTWLYIDRTREFVLAMLLLVNLGAAMLMTVYTASFVHEIMRRLRFLPDDGDGINDLLMLSKIDAKTYVQGVWWTTVRRLWPDYLLLAVPRIGLAYGLAQYLHMVLFYIPTPPFTQINTIYPLFNPAFQYISYSDFAAPLQPNFDTVVIGGIALVILSFFEAGFATALVTLAAMFTPRSKLRTSLLAIVFRLVIVVAVAQAIRVMRPINQAWYIEIACCGCGSAACSEADPASTRDVQFRTALRALETGQVTLTILSDGGALLGANIMRPFGEASIYGRDWGYVRVGQTYQFQMTRNTNVPFVLRNILSAGLGVIMYLVLTWGLLRLTRLFAYMRGFG